jgi:hypothetical protein
MVKILFTDLITYCLVKVLLIETIHEIKSMQALIGFSLLHFYRRGELNPLWNRYFKWHWIW